MCLHINQVSHPDLLPRRTTVDLLVYKVLLLINGSDSHYMSPFQGHRYTLGKKLGIPRGELRSERISPSLDFTDIKIVKLTSRVEYGLHAYRATTPTDALKTFYRMSVADADECYHSLPAVIPAGSQYYIGNDDDIVADTLVVYPDLEALKAVYPDIMVVV